MHGIYKRARRLELKRGIVSDKGRDDLSVFRKSTRAEPITARSMNSGFLNINIKVKPRPSMIPVFLKQGMPPLSIIEKNSFIQIRIHPIIRILKKRPLPK